MSFRLSTPDIDHVFGDLRRSVLAVQHEPALDVTTDDLMPGIRGALRLVQTTHIDCIATPSEASTVRYQRLVKLAALAVHAAHQEARAQRDPA